MTSPHPATAPASTLAQHLPENLRATSPTQLHFLELAARLPDSTRRDAFPALAERDAVVDHDVQPWPYFLDRELRDELIGASAALCRLVKAIPARLFGNDPARLAEHYRLPREVAAVIATVLEKTDCLEGAVGRVDLIETAAGFKCCELNMSGGLGGWQMAAWAEKYRALPLVQRFLDERRRAGQSVDLAVTHPLRAVFRHAVARARRDSRKPERLNLAMVFKVQPPDEWSAYVREEYRATLGQGAGLAGELFVCIEEQLLASDGQLRYAGRPVHAVLDLRDGGFAGQSVLQALLAGSVDVYNGPLTLMLSDKLNLALLSEHADSELFSAEERAVIRARVPWSRRVADDFVDYRGERVYIPDLLHAERQQLVLKLGLSLRGKDVHLGRSTPAARWEELVRRALAEGGWLVQELLDPVPYPFQCGEDGWAFHDVAWGLFIFGDSYGGGFLRVLPSGGTGVVNRAQGALNALIFEVDSDAQQVRGPSDPRRTLDLDAEQRAVHGDLSTTHLRFFDFLKERPEGLERSHFAPVHVSDEFTPFPVQSWPVFLGADRRRRFAHAATAVSKLVRSLPVRFFGGDAAKIQSFYGVSREQAVLTASLIRSTGILAGAFGRCDFLDTAHGLQFIEFNAGGNVSGWQTAMYLDRFARIPVIRDFADQTPGAFFFNHPVRALLAHLIAEGRDLADDGALNLCFAVDSTSHLGQWVRYLQSEYAAVLAAVGDGLTGALIACELDALTATGGALRAGDERIHIVYEPSYGRLTRPLLVALLARQARLYNGPTSRLLGDKANLALLSEHATSGLFTDEERAAIAAYVPWTRRVLPEHSERRGEKHYLPDLLLADRERLVLKARFSLGGKQVHVGRFTPPAKWAGLVRQALADGLWIVQEYVPSPSYLFLGDSGCVPHDLVWGLFTLGDSYGGNYFRVQQKANSRGVVNATQGASFGLVLEVEASEEDIAAIGYTPWP